MRYQKGLSRLIVVAVALSLVLSSTVAFAAERTATVTLNPVGDGSGSTAVAGQVTVTDSKGPGGTTTLSVTLRNTVAGTTYALWLGRMNHDFRVIGLVTWVEGNGGDVTVSIQLEKAPTNGQSFELVAFSKDGTAGRVVAISDPIKY